ncbi:MAG: GTPase HflX, partial [Pseudomonadota bacterium]
SDTVGFISNLPTELVAAFRATLEEVLGADLILHVRDISHDETELQAQDVDTILASLGVDEERPRLEVLNKIDLLGGDERDAVLARTHRDRGTFAISAVTGEGVQALLREIAAKLHGVRHQTTLNLGFADGGKRAWLFRHDVVRSEEQTEKGFEITVLWTEKQAAQFSGL